MLLAWAVPPRFAGTRIRLGVQGFHVTKNQLSTTFFAHPKIPLLKDADPSGSAIRSRCSSCSAIGTSEARITSASEQRMLPG